MACKDEEIDVRKLVKEFGRVVVNAGDRKVTIPQKGKVKIQRVKKQNNSLLNKIRKKNALKPGDMTEDGRVYVGINWYGNDIFTKGGYGVRKWEEAMTFAKRKGAYLGSDHELGMLQKNIIEGILQNKEVPEADKKPLKKMFDLSGSNPSGLVWSGNVLRGSTPALIQVQRLSDGSQRVASPNDVVSPVLFWKEPKPKSLMKRLYNLLW